MLGLKRLKTMENLEPEPGFYDLYGYGDNEKYLLHDATVSLLNIYIYNNHVTY